MSDSLQLQTRRRTIAVTEFTTGTLDTAPHELRVPQRQHPAPPTTAPAAPAARLDPVADQPAQPVHTDQPEQPEQPVRLVAPDLPRTDPNPRPHRTQALRHFRRLGAFVFSRRWRISRHGTENIPARGPVILAANHLGVIDGPLLVAMTPRTTFALAKSELFENRLGALLTWLGQIPLARHYVDTHAIRRSVHVLRSQHCLAIFPEGVRNRGDLASIRGGAAYLAMVTGASIVPVALLGTRQPGQSVRDLPKKGSALHIVYGEPIAISQVPWPRRKAEVAEQTEYVRRRLQAHLTSAQETTGMELPGDPVQPATRIDSAGRPGTDTVTSEPTIHAA